VLPDLLSGGRIPGLQFTIMIGARAHLEAESLPGSSGTFSPLKPPQKLSLAGSRRSDGRNEARISAT
jgi:hypothetical protein